MKADFDTQYKDKLGRHREAPPKFLEERLTALYNTTSGCPGERGAWPMRRIKRNAIRCNLCGDIIESKDRHDFVTCSCGACSVDGGKDYLRRGFKGSADDYTELSEYEGNYRGP